MMYRLGLEHLGFDVEVAEHAAALFAAIPGGSAQTIVMEWENLGLSGLQTLLRLRSGAESRDVPVLILSNQDGDIEGLTRQALEAGAQRWLVKAHTTPSELARNIREVLAAA